MSYTQADIDAMETAIKTGELDVQHGDRRVRYRSLAELMQILAYAKRQFQGAASAKHSLANWET